MKEVKIEIVASVESYTTTATRDGVEVFRRTWTRTPTGATAPADAQDPWDLTYGGLKFPGGVDRHGSPDLPEEDDEEDDRLPDAIETVEGVGLALMYLCDD